MQDFELLRMAVNITTQAVARQTMTADEVAAFLKGTHTALYDAANPTPQAEPEVQQKRRGRPRKVSTEIVDKAKAKEAMVEEVISDNFNEMIDENDISEDDNVVGEITADENGELSVPMRPEPMFED